MRLRKEQRAYGIPGDDVEGFHSDENWYAATLVIGKLYGMLRESLACPKAPMRRLSLFRGHRLKGASALTVFFGQTFCTEGKRKSKERRFTAIWA